MKLKSLIPLLVMGCLTLILTTIVNNKANASTNAPAAVQTVITTNTVADDSDIHAFVLNRSGNPVVAYLDSSNNLKLEVCSGSNCTAAATTVVAAADSNGAGADSALDLAINSSGHPVIAYTDKNDYLQFTVCGDATCASGNTTTLVDGSATVVDLALQLTGTGLPVIAYQDVNSGNDLKAAICSNPTCAGKTIQTLDSDAYYPSLALTASGYPVISYASGIPFGLKVAICNDATCTTQTPVNVDNSGNVGSDSSIALTSAEYPVISYYDNNNEDLKLAICGDAACTNKTLHTLDSNGTVGSFTSLALNGSGWPVIAYQGTASSSTFLKLAVCGDASCTSPTLTTLTSTDEPGFNSSLALDSQNVPYVVHANYAATPRVELSRYGIPAAWPMFRHDSSHTGRSPYNGPDSPALKWAFATDGPIYSSPAIGADGTIYVGSYDKKLYAFDPADGTKKWDFATGSSVLSSPAIGADGTIYVGSGDGKLYAINPADGTKKWDFATGNVVSSSPVIGADGTIYVGYHDFKLYAINPADGTKKWGFATGNIVHSSPAIGADGTIYVGSNDGNLYAINPADGTKKWDFATGDVVRPSPAIEADGTIYVGSYDGNLYAINPADGTKKWDFATGSTVNSSPTIGTDGMIYVGSDDGKLYAINPADGTKKWGFDTGSSVHSSPAIGADGMIYVGSDDGKLYAINPADGTKKWGFDTGRSVHSSPAIGADGTIYIGSFDNNLYAITSPSVYTVNPGTGGSVTTDNGALQISYLANSLPSNAAQLQYAPLANGSHGSPPGQTILAANLQLLNDKGQIIKNSAFNSRLKMINLSLNVINPPLNVILTYQDEDVPVGMDENTLKLYYYSESQSKWVEIPEADIIARDTAANTIEFKLDRMAQFILSGPYNVYIPMIIK